MSGWTFIKDMEGKTVSAKHSDGHRMGHFQDGWWAYHRDWRYARPNQPRVGPEPAGPFKTLGDALGYVESQGWMVLIPFESVPQAPSARLG